jgi:nucleoside phosphorylase
VSLDDRRRSAQPQADIGSKSQPVIGILTALPLERQAVEHLIDYLGARVMHKTPQTGGYLIATLPSEDGYHCVLVPPESKGQEITASTVTEVAERFPTVRIFIFLGIAGGVEGEISRGDVVVSDHIIDSDPRRVDPHKTSDRTICPEPDARLIGAINALRQPGEVAIAQWTAMWQDFARSKPVRAAFPSWSDATGPVAQSKLRPRIKVATIASGDTVVNNRRTRDLWRKTHTFVAFETEGAAVARASHRLQRGYLVVRGISDLGDGTMNSKGAEFYRPFSAHVAAALLGGILRRVPSQHIESSVPVVSLPSNLTAPLPVVPKLTTYSDQAGFLYRMGRQIAEQAERVLLIVQRTPTLLFDPELLAELTGEKQAHFDEEVEFRDTIARRARDALPGRDFSFTILFPLEMARAELRDSKRYPGDTGKELRDHVARQVDIWKAIEAQSSRGARPGEGFRIDAIQGRVSGPLAVSEKQCCVWLGGAKGPGPEGVFSISVNEFDLDTAKEFSRDLGSLSVSPRLSADQLKAKLLRDSK